MPVTPHCILFMTLTIFPFIPTTIGRNYNLGWEGKNRRRRWANKYRSSLCTYTGAHEHSHTKPEYRETGQLTWSVLLQTPPPHPPPTWTLLSLGRDCLQKKQQIICKKKGLLLRSVAQYFLCRGLCAWTGTARWKNPTTVSDLVYAWRRAQRKIFFFHSFSRSLIQQTLTSTCYVAGLVLRLGIQRAAEMITVPDLRELTFYWGRWHESGVKQINMVLQPRHML